MDYSRHELVEEIGKTGQKKIMNCSAAVVGLGGIGCASANLLVRAGVKKLVLIDRDIVDESNLQRQLLFENSDIGKPKALAASDSLSRINGKTKLFAEACDLDRNNVNLLNQDIVLDCTDNLETRFLINEYCKNKRIPWVYSAAIRNECFVLAVLPSGPCLRCLFDDFAPGETCETMGVTGWSVVLAASLQVNEAVKILLGRPYISEMMRFDLWKNKFESFSLRKNSSCPVCKGTYDYLSGKKGSNPVRLCGSGTYQIKGNPLNLIKLKKNSEVKDFKVCIGIGDVTVFSDGRALIKASSETEARSKYSRLIG